MPDQRIRPFRYTAHALLAAAFVLTSVAGCGRGQTESAVVTLDGSSTVFPISEAVAEEFGKAERIHVTVGRSGTGGGFQKFCRGETDISGASRPIKAVERDACAQAGITYVELPVAYDGLAVVVHPANTWATSITVAELKTLWEPAAEGKVTRWNQIRPDWPNREVHLFGAGVDSGTFDYFTGAINGKEGASRGDYTSSEDDNVIVQGVSRDEGALGYFGYAYYHENKNILKVVAVDDLADENGKGPIAPSPESVRDGQYQPLSRPIFIYASIKALEKREVNAFVQFYLTNAPKLVAEVGYLPLTDQEYTLVRGRLDARTPGSMFTGGSQVGVRLEALLGSGR
jgi:phosphate transport system substrate-binding protein